MDNIHDALNLSMEQTRWILKRIVDGENTLIADILFANPMQLMDVMVCAAAMLNSLQRTCPEAVDKLFTKELPD